MKGTPPMTRQERRKGRFVYFVEWHSDGRFIVRQLDREDAHVLAITGHAVQVFDTIEEAYRERAILRDRHKGKES